MAWMETNTVWVETPAQVDAMAAQLKGADLVAVDTEFIRETTFYPKIALIQIATHNRVWLVDPVALAPAELEPLLEVLTSPDSLKVMHAALGDQECFFYSYGVVVAPVLDTAAAAALLGYGDNVGLAKLMKDVLGLQLPKGRARVHWLERPLAPELKRYAEGDVRHLVELAQTILADLQALGRREWALEIGQHSRETFAESSESVADRVARGTSLDGPGAGCLYELVLWRENRARSADRPRGWIADNSVLISLARSRPKNLEELSRFRGLGPKEVQRNGNEILRALERGMDLRLEITSGDRRAPTADEEMVMVLVKAFLAVLSMKYRIAPRLLMTADRMIDLVRSSGSGRSLWVSSHILSTHVDAMIGAELENLLAGRCALGLKDGRLTVLDQLDQKPR